jgi:PASTA domain
MHRRVRKLHRAPIFLAAMLASLSLCASAAADVTVGEVAPPNPESICNFGSTDTIELGTTGGDSYMVPEAGVLTSWSTSAGPGAGQALTLKVYRPAGGTTYAVLAQDGPRSLTPSVLNTFPIDIPVQAGDVLGLNDGEALPDHRLVTDDACEFETTSPADIEGGLLGDAGVGSLLDFEASDTRGEVRANVSANLQPTSTLPPVVTPTTPTAAGPPTSGPPAPAPRCVVPRLGAKKLKAAKAALKKADCRLGRVAKSKGATAKSGVVASQNPQSGKTLAAGTKVAVTLVPPIT